MLSDILVVLQGGANVIRDTDKYKESLMFIAKHAALQDIYYAVEVLSELRIQLRQQESQEESTLLAIIRICDDRVKPDYQKLLSEVERLKRELAELKRTGIPLQTDSILLQEEKGENPAKDAKTDRDENLPLAEEVLQEKTIEEKEQSEGWDTTQEKTPFDSNTETGKEDDAADRAGVPGSLSSLLDDFDVMSLL